MTEELVSFDPARFGGQVRAWREAARLSQSELARRAGVAQSLLSRTEAGDRREPPSLGICLQLNQALGLPRGAVLHAAGAAHHDPIPLFVAASTSPTDPTIEIVSVLDGAIQLLLVDGLVQVDGQTDLARLCALVDTHPQLDGRASANLTVSTMEREDLPLPLLRLLSAVMRVVEADAALRRLRGEQETGSRCTGSGNGSEVT